MTMRIFIPCFFTILIITVYNIFQFTQNWEGLLIQNSISIDGRAQSEVSRTTISLSDIPVERQWPPSKDYLMAAARNDTLIVTTVNCGFLDFLENWILSMQRQNINNFMVVALDRASYEAIGRQWPGHVLWPQEIFGEDAVQAFDYGTKGFLDVTSFRPKLLKILINLGINAVYSDVDQVWLGDAMQYLDGVEEDFAVAPDGYPSLGIFWCTCFLYLRPAPINVKFLDEWVRYFEKEGVMNDQDAFNPAFQAFKSKMQYHVLDIDQFPPGSLYFVSEQLNITWNPDKPTLVAHANWIMGSEVKRMHMKGKQVWYNEGLLTPCL